MHGPSLSELVCLNDWQTKARLSAKDEKAQQYHERLNNLNAFNDKETAEIFAALKLLIKSNGGAGNADAAAVKGLSATQAKTILNSLHKNLSHDNLSKRLVDANFKPVHYYDPERALGKICALYDYLTYRETAANGVKDGGSAAQKVIADTSPVVRRRGLPPKLKNYSLPDGLLPAAGDQSGFKKTMELLTDLTRNTGFTDRSIEFRALFFDVEKTNNPKLLEQYQQQIKTDVLFCLLEGHETVKRLALDVLSQYAVNHHGWPYADFLDSLLVDYRKKFLPETSAPVSSETSLTTEETDDDHADDNDSYTDRSRGRVGTEQGSVEHPHIEQVADVPVSESGSFSRQKFSEWVADGVRATEKGLIQLVTKVKDQLSPQEVIATEIIVEAEWASEEPGSNDIVASETRPAQAVFSAGLESMDPYSYPSPSSIFDQSTSVPSERSVTTTDTMTDTMTDTATGNTEEVVDSNNLSSNSAFRLGDNQAGSYIDLTNSIGNQEPSRNIAMLTQGASKLVRALKDLTWPTKKLDTPEKPVVTDSSTSVPGETEQILNESAQVSSPAPLINGHSPFEKLMSRVDESHNSDDHTESEKSAESSALNKIDAQAPESNQLEDVDINDISTTALPSAPNSSAQNGSDKDRSMLSDSIEDSGNQNQSRLQKFGTTIKLIGARFGAGKKNEEVDVNPAQDSGKQDQSTLRKIGATIKSVAGFFGAGKKSGADDYDPVEDSGNLDQFSSQQLGATIKSMGASFGAGKESEVVDLGIDDVDDLHQSD